MFELAKLAGYLLSPLTLALALWLLAGGCLLLRWRRLALGLACVAFVGLWLASTPLVAQALQGELESSYPAVAPHDSPKADAIVLLGGALIGALPPHRPNFSMGPDADRVWHAAALFRAGKAPWIIVAAGNQPDEDDQQVEADAIAEMLQVLGVPESAIRSEGQSRNTRENADNIRALVHELGARRVLLVTSARHMPRAVKSFAQSWQGSGVELIAAPTNPRSGRNYYSLSALLPSVGALVVVTKSLKEFAGSLALAIM